MRSLTVKKQSDDLLQYVIHPGVIHAWMIELAIQKIDFQTCEQCLDAEELVRADSYKNIQDRKRFIARRAILRMLLGRYLNQPADKIKFETNSNGKLLVVEAPIFFNVSHSRDRIAFAFGLADKIGIDIEKVEPIPEMVDLVDKWFSTGEKAAFSMISPQQKMDAFYHVWTQKEAFIKALGLGLSFPLQDVSVLVDPDKPGKILDLRRGNPRLWKITTFELNPGWKIALCVQAKKYPKITWQKFQN